MHLVVVVSVISTLAKTTSGTCRSLASGQAKNARCVCLSGSVCAVSNAMSIVTAIVFCQFAGGAAVAQRCAERQGTRPGDRPAPVGRWIHTRRSPGSSQ